MAISRASNSSIQGGLPKFNDIWDGTTATSAFDTLGVAFASTAVSSITFSNIPQTYTHLQLRSFITQGTGGSSTGSDTFNTGRFNSDSGSNYISHAILGDGASATASVTSASSTSMWFGICPTGATSSFNTNIIDILDYSSTNKNKTVRGFLGHDRNGAGVIVLQSVLWMNSASGINSMTIFATAGNFSINSHFALYGIK